MKFCLFCLVYFYKIKIVLHYCYNTATRTKQREIIGRTGGWGKLKPRRRRISQSEIRKPSVKRGRGRAKIPPLKPLPRVVFLILPPLPRKETSYDIKDVAARRRRFRIGRRRWLKTGRRSQTGVGGRRRKVSLWLRLKLWSHLFPELPFKPLHLFGRRNTAGEIPFNPLRSSGWRSKTFG